MPDGKQHLGVQKRNGRSGKEICRCYLPHITVGQCGDILADALFRHTFGILAQNHAIQTKSAVRRLDNDMGRLAGLLNGTGKGKGDDVGGYAHCQHCSGKQRRDASRFARCRFLQSSLDIPLRFEGLAARYDENPRY